jgi:hypothetical protein
MLVLFLLVPSGLWMAYYAQTGTIAAIGFASLAIVTGICVLFGWQCAVKRKFAEHRRWMWRCFLLLCSAVVIRLIGGLAEMTETGGDWIYPAAAWASWSMPLALFELGDVVKRHSALSGARGTYQFARSAAGVSLPSMEISARRVSAGVSSIKN